MYTTVTMVVRKAYKTTLMVFTSVLRLKKATVELKYRQNADQLLCKTGEMWQCKMETMVMTRL